VAKNSGGGKGGEKFGRTGPRVNGTRNEGFFFQKYFREERMAIQKRVFIVCVKETADVRCGGTKNLKGNLISPTLS